MSELRFWKGSSNKDDPPLLQYDAAGDLLVLFLWVKNENHYYYI